MDLHATGTFEVTATPEPAAPDVLFARLRIAKRFAGDLDATGVVEMMSAMTPVKGSAAYVALERVDGTLAGRRGSFLLHHTGVMDRGRPSLAIAVVPDSGTGALAGLTGTMSIEIANGVHRYAFAGAIPGDG